jgi:hypothetical protein
MHSWMQVSGQLHAPTVLSQRKTITDIVRRGGWVGTKTGLPMALREEKKPCRELDPGDPTYTRS